uniref:Predicted protein n=1 Tax=Hordeum vulgare subsp. vulgare TaxID=112509 RepID=F2DZR6_HORVV|nr:predicted protein [Hordeum vulgare subsp. vulgare]
MLQGRHGHSQNCKTAAPASATLEHRRQQHASRTPTPAAPSVLPQAGPRRSPAVTRSCKLVSAAPCSRRSATSAWPCHHCPLFRQL